MRTSREMREAREGKRSLADVHGAFDKLVLMPTHGAIDIALAGVVANYANGDPVWPLLVGPPGSGKSEIITALTSAPDVWSLSSLTPQTLLSGFERKDKHSSLLLQIGAFGILAFKDLTTVLTMHRDARGPIIGQLREVADGKTEKSFGNGLRLEWEGKLGLIAGVTPIIDEMHGVLAVMGERFLLFRMPATTRRMLARRALDQRGEEEALRSRIRLVVAEFLAQFRNCERLSLPDTLTDPLIELADIVTRARSGVARDGYSREIVHLPEPEVPTRLVKQLAQLTAALIAIGVDEEAAWALIRKTGWDSVPAVRLSVLKCLAEQSEDVPTAVIEEATGLPNATVNRVVEDLVVLDLAGRHKESNRWMVGASAITLQYWAGESPPETSDGAQGDAAPETSEGAQYNGHEDIDEVERLAQRYFDFKEEGT